MKKNLIKTLCATAALSFALAASTGALAATTIGQSAARTAALEYSGFRSEEVDFFRTKLDREDGRQIYEVSLTTDTAEYEYDIDAQTGDVLQYEMELFYSQRGSSTGTAIGLTKAKSLALADAGFKSEDVTFLKERLTRDDGLRIYDIEFYADGAKYEYELNAASGKIVQQSIDYFLPASSGSGSQVSPGGNSDCIGVSKAKSIAVKDAGTTTAKAEFIKAKFDYDDGRATYDVEFYADNVKYEYDIDAKTGEIIGYDAEDYGHSAGTGSSVTLSEAKAIALDHAGVSASKAEFYKSGRDYDDGRIRYEFEFIAGNVKYEYEIDASTGRVVTYEKETIRQTSGSAGGSVSADKAEEIALDHAGLSAGSVWGLRTKYERDDGIMVYEVEFRSGRYEYEYTISASTGRILEWDKDYDD